MPPRGKLLHGGGRTMTATRRQLERDLIAAWPTPRRDDALRRYYDVTPHPDRLIEASRPRPEPEDDNRGHVMLCWLMIAIAIIGAALIFWTLWVATVSRVQTEMLVTPEAAIELMEGR